MIRKKKSFDKTNINPYTNEEWRINIIVWNECYCNVVVDSNVCWIKTSAIHMYVCLNSMWPSDAIWWHRSGSTLTRVTACCLTALCHYLNQCWLLISEVLWHSSESNFTASAQATVLYNEFENYSFKITATSPRGQRVDISMMYATLWNTKQKRILTYLVYLYKSGPAFNHSAFNFLSNASNCNDNSQISRYIQYKTDLRALTCIQGKSTQG